ncbi:T9SS type A sorting domain-containing protein [Nubsella zeaxanthinifaciens]|uniref:T9SS type A sorting domain-containing protein n=1 Tax=Nubsella zeaxanthinifaciens TaxID=392412 RepID=UPI000DE30533|nr:T9SS type A sorting domain-containing protein [Nubsella zeaxanthinifaciens]
MKKLLLLFLLISRFATVGYGQIFTQNFSSSTVVSDYVDATNGYVANKFTAISSLTNSPSSVSGGRLTFSKTGNSASYLSQIKDMGATVLIVSFDFSVSGQSAAGTSAVVFNVGSAFGNNSSAYTGSTGGNSRFAINFAATSGEFTVRDIVNTTNSANTYSGNQTITFVVNNKAVGISYDSPTGNKESLPAYTWDLWVGNTREFNDVAVENSSNALNNFKISAQSSAPNCTMSFDNFVIKDQMEPTVLPVALNAFKAKANLQQVDLTWNTAAETNNARFEILRSADGKTFNKIDEVSGAGTSTENRSYAYTDQNPLPGVNYYKLKQVDFDGQYSFSEVEAVKSNVAASNFKVAANKQSGTVKLTVYAANNGKATFKIYDLNGRKLAEQELNLSKGYSNVSVPFNGGNGLLIASLTTPTETLTQKFIQ